MPKMRSESGTRGDDLRSHLTHAGLLAHGRRINGDGMASDTLVSSNANTFAPARMYFTCTVVGAGYLVLLGVSGMALIRVLRAAARDAWESPRRRLLALDEDVDETRKAGRAWSVGAACIPWTTQKAILTMATFVSLRESPVASGRIVESLVFAKCCLFHARDSVGGQGSQRYWLACSNRSFGTAMCALSTSSC